jgi:hemerythrin superfamily protein
MTEQTNTVEFERGDKVNHSKWGIGTILYKSGSGERTKVIVLFQDVGQKTLLVKYAKLEKLASSPVKSKDREKALENLPEIETVAPAHEAEEDEVIPEVADVEIEDDDIEEDEEEL